MTRARLLGLCGLWLFVASPSALADSVNLGASKDNTLYQDPDGTLSNAMGMHFFSGRTSGGSMRRAVIAFDVAGNIPAGSTIDSVVLTLRLSRTRFGSQTTELRRVLADWGEGPSNATAPEGQGDAAGVGDATWTHTFSPGAFWSSPGGDFSATVSASQSVGAIGFYNWGSSPNMVADVQSWLDSPAGNFGWLILGNETNTGSAKRFDSRENSTESFRPRLTINFTPPAGDPCPKDDPDDTDGDGVCDSDDVCPGGDDELDADGDSVPNFCDPCPQDNPNDSDGDGVCNSADPCSGSPNVDSDADGICDSTDPCTGFPNVDGDGDGVCNGTDPCIGSPNVDTDGDGLCDSSDPCAGTPNVDSDGDGLCDSGDPCNGFPNIDSDGDGVCDSADLCIGSPNVDSDGDGVCDAADPCPQDAANDSDGDGVCDVDDRCPGENDGLDADGNGTPDCLERGIPTVSEWGLTIMALLFLTVWKVRFARLNDCRPCR